MPRSKTLSALLGLSACCALTACPSEEQYPAEPPPPPPVAEPAPPAQPAVVYPEEYAHLMFANLGAAPQLLRLRALRGDVAIDCAALAEDPAGMLDPSLFAPASAWMLDPGRAMSVTPNSTAGACGVALVDGPDLEARLVFFEALEHPATSLSTEARAVPAERALIFDGAVGEVVWRPHPALSVLRAAEAAPLACRTPAPGTGVDWSQPPLGTVGLFGVEVGADGCHRLDVEHGETDHRWFACVPGAELPFAVEETLIIEPLAVGAAGMRVDGLSITGPQGRVVLTRGVDLPAEIGPWTAEASPECAGHVDACGGFVQAARVQVQAEGEAVWLEAEEDITLGARRTLYLSRAQRAMAVDRACMPYAQPGQFTFEAALIERFAEPGEDLESDGPESEVPESEVPESERPEDEPAEGDDAPPEDGGMAGEPTH